LFFSFFGSPSSLLDKAKEDAAKSTSSPSSGPKTASDIKKESDEILDKSAAKQKESLTALDRINQKIGETEKVWTLMSTSLVDPLSDIVKFYRSVLPLTRPWPRIGRSLRP